MQKEPLVSIIVACHNAENFIDNCLKALINQTYKNIEIIVCDDASTDRSIALLRDWAEKDSRIIVLYNKDNLFAAATRNRCFDIAKGEYYCIQDIDDISKLDRIEKLVREIQTDNVDFVSSSMQCFNESNGIQNKIISHKQYPSKWAFLWGISFCHPATLFTKECIMDVGGYRVSQDTRRCQDYDMFMRLYAKGYKGKNISESLYLYRLDEDTIKRGANYTAAMCEYNVRKYGFKVLALPYVLRKLCALKPLIAYAYQLLLCKCSIK